MPTPLPKRVVIPPDVLSRELDGEGVLLNLETERYYTLDDVGIRMWQLLAEHGDVETVVAQLLDEYNVEQATLRHDLADLIAGLVEANLITVET